jgi:hypothetical protein
MGGRIIPAAPSRLRRFDHAKGLRASVVLGSDHPAIREGRTLFPSTRHYVEETGRVLKSGHNSRKIGKVVTKGKWRGFPRSSALSRSIEMERAGFLPGPIRSDTKGFVRFDAPGDKAGKGNGFYKLKTASIRSAGSATGAPASSTNGSSRARPAAERGRAQGDQREQSRLKAEAQVARETRQAEVAEDASRMWGKADGNVEGHPYLVRKQISVPRGLRIYTAKDGVRLLAVPMWSFDLNGVPKLTSLQLIGADGDKRFLKAGRVEGTFFSIKGDTSIIVICEGVATAFSIWEATGPLGRRGLQRRQPDRGGEGVRAVAAARPAADRAPTTTRSRRRLGRARRRPAVGQPGREESRGGGQGGRVPLDLCRIFEAGERRGLTDFNDLHRGRAGRGPRAGRRRLQDDRGRGRGARRHHRPVREGPGRELAREGAADQLGDSRTAPMSKAWPSTSPTIACSAAGCASTS